MRKEYNDRWNAPLVNPGFTMEEYELSRIRARFEAQFSPDCICAQGGDHAPFCENQEVLNAQIKR